MDALDMVADRLEGIGDVDPFEALHFRPNPGPQSRFLGLPDANLDVLYGGAAGGSKSTSLLMYGLRACYRFPGLQAFWFRRSFPELEQSVLRMLARYNYAKAIGGRYNGSTHELRFSNGSVFTFGHAKNIAEVSALQSAEINLLLIDERTTIPPDVVDQLYVRVRSGVAGVPCLGVRSACVDEGDVLTESGWKPIQDVKVGELVQSIDPDGNMSLKPVEWVFAGPATEGLVRVNKPSLYMSMTPDHRVVHQRPTSPRHRITPWNELPHKSVRIVRAAASYEAEGRVQAPFGWDADDYLAFLGLFLAEGCTNSTVRKANYKTVITQCTEDNQTAIKDLLNRLTMPRRGTIRVLPSGNFNVRYYDDANDPIGVPGRGSQGRKRLNKTFGTRQEAEEFLASVRVPLRWSLSANGDFQITRKELWEHFRQFGKAHEKFVPREILERADAGQLQLLLDWMVFGDGSVRGQGIRYFTCSRQLADDVQEMALKLGYKVQTRAKDDGNPAHRTRYIVACNRDCRATLIEHARNPREVETVPFTGDVYCIKVRDNENFFLRQRGCIWVSGNTNPGGIGHSRVRTEYVDATNHGEQEISDGNGRRRIFIQARVSDTPQLGDEYKRNLQGLDEKLRKAFLDGDWGVFAGQAFSEWRYDRHVVQPFEIPATWKRYAGIDWGYTAPWSVLWGAVDEDSRVWIYRELYATQVAESEQARQIVEAEAGEHVLVRYADDAMWASRGEAKPIATVYTENGAHLTAAGKGSGSRISGWQRIHSYLAEAPACPHHRELGWETCPKLHVFPQAANLIRTLPALPHATVGNPEDIDTKAEDHSADSLRYLLINLGTGPEMVILDAPSPESVVEVLQPLGPTMAYRPAEPDLPDAGWWLDDDEKPRAGGTVTSPWA